MAEIRAYECNVKGKNWQQTIHADSRGRAKSVYLREVQEPWPDVPFTDIECHSLGEPIQTREFRNTAKRRGVPFARIGMRVTVGGHTGTIIGSNSSANFDVLFAEGPHKGLTLNCHPHSEMRYFDEDGAELGDPA